MVKNKNVSETISFSAMTIHGIRVHRDFFNTIIIFFSKGLL